MTDLSEIVSEHARKAPDVPASLMLSVKHYDELCRLIPCYPVTPLRVAAERLTELEASNES